MKVSKACSKFFTWFRARCPKFGDQPRIPGSEWEMYGDMGAWFGCHFSDLQAYALEQVALKAFDHWNRNRISADWLPFVVLQKSLRLVRYGSPFSTAKALQPLGLQALCPGSEDARFGNGSKPVWTPSNDLVPCACVLIRHGPSAQCWPKFAIHSHQLGWHLQECPF